MLAFAALGSVWVVFKTKKFYQIADGAVAGLTQTSESPIEISLCASTRDLVGLNQMFLNLDSVYQTFKNFPITYTELAESFTTLAQIAAYTSNAL